MECIDWKVFVCIWHQNIRVRHQKKFQSQWVQVHFVMHSPNFQKKKTGYFSWCKSTVVFFVQFFRSFRKWKKRIKNKLKGKKLKEKTALYCKCSIAYSATWTHHSLHSLIFCLYWRSIFRQRNSAAASILHGYILPHFKPFIWRTFFFPEKKGLQCFLFMYCRCSTENMVRHLTNSPKPF